jgi:hypothetical protein
VASIAANASKSTTHTTATRFCIPSCTSVFGWVSDRSAMRQFLVLLEVVLFFALIQNGLTCASAPS